MILIVMLKHVSDENLLTHNYSYYLATTTFTFLISKGDLDQGEENAKISAGSVEYLLPIDKVISDLLTDWQYCLNLMILSFCPRELFVNCDIEMFMYGNKHRQQTPYIDEQQAILLHASGSGRFGHG